jgi:hypothetical protein
VVNADFSLLEGTRQLMALFQAAHMPNLRSPL